VLGELKGEPEAPLLDKRQHTMSHWHEYRVCKEYFDCRSEASHRLSVRCPDCARKLRETLIVDSALKQLVQLPSGNN